MAPYPQQVAHKHWEPNGQGSRTQSPISPLIRHGKDTDHELQSQEYLYGGGHSQTDAWLKLKAYRHVRQKKFFFMWKYLEYFNRCSNDVFNISVVDWSISLYQTNELTNSNTPSYRVQGHIASHIAWRDPIQHTGSS